MTYEEAIEIFKNTSCATKKAQQALALAIEALEMRIPRKPLNAKDKAGICPTCGNYICLAWHESACGDCGQAIDWD